MKKKREIPRLNLISFHYNGNQNQFENFLSSMAADYLNSGNLPEYIPKDFVDYIEFWGNSEKPLDI